MWWHNLDNWRTVIVTFSGVGQTAFVLLYLAFPWWRTFLGRALFFQAVALAAVFDLIAFARWTHHGRDDLVFAVVYGILSLSIWWQLITFVRVKRRGSEL